MSDATTEYAARLNLADTVARLSVRRPKPASSWQSTTSWLLRHPSYGVIASRPHLGRRALGGFIAAILPLISEAGGSIDANPPA